MKAMCKHPKNYHKACNNENCPPANERGTTYLEIITFSADRDCEYGYFIEEEK